MAGPDQPIAETIARMVERTKIVQEAAKEAGRVIRSGQLPVEPEPQARQSSR